MSTPEGLAPSLRWTSIVTVWVAALAASILIAVFSERSQVAAWLGLALAACVVGSLAAQIATQERHGFVDRLAASLIGAFVIIGSSGGIIALASLAH